MLRVLEVWLLISLISLAGLAVAECPKGDLSGDCRVDFLDVRALASQWLYPSSSPGDLDGLNGVEARDWAILADDWRQVGIPLVINEVLASNSRTNAELYTKPPDAVGYPVYLDEPAGTPLLFNLAADPLERQDLAALEPDRVSRMMCELENWFEDVERDRRSIPDRQYRNAAAMRARRKEETPAGGTA